MGRDARQGPIPGWLERLFRRIAGHRTAELVIGDIEQEYRRARERGHVSGAGIRLLADVARSLIALGADRARRGLHRRAGAVAAGPATLTDLRFALRGLVRRPGSSGMIVLLLTLAIGGSAGLLSLIDGILLRPLPYPEADRVAVVWARNDRDLSRTTRVPGPTAAYLRQRASSFASTAFVTGARDRGLQLDGEPLSTTLANTTPELFSLLGAEILMGRGFTERDLPIPTVDEGGVDLGPLIISERLWTRALGRRRDVVGLRVRVDGLPTRIIGVMGAAAELQLPASAGFPDRIDGWLPLPAPLRELRRDDGRLLDQDSDNTGVLLGRLAPDASLESARKELRRLGRGLRSGGPGQGRSGLELEVAGLQERLTAPVRPLAILLLLGAAMLLLLSGANVSTLLLVQLERRAGEIAVRAALGARASRLRHQLLLEAASLLLAGGALGTVLATAVLPALRVTAPSAFRMLAPATPSWAALAAAIGSQAAVLLPLSGAASVRVTSAGLLEGLRTGRGQTDVGGARFWLVTAQVAFSLLFLLAVGLLGRTGVALSRVDPGFQADGVLTFEMSLRGDDRWRGPADRARFVDSLSRRILELPDVSAVGVTAALPLSGELWSQPFGPPGTPPETWREHEAEFRAVTSGAFEALGTRIVAGRGFLPEEDLHEERRVVIVDEALAGILAPDGEVVGAALGIPLDGDPVEAEIVGVVERVRHRSLREPGLPTIYVPYRQEASRNVAFVVRSRGDPTAAMAEIRALVADAAPGTPVHDPRSLYELVGADTAPTRFALTLSGLFAVLALLSAVAGLYGLLAVILAGRRREIGVRIALGAGPRAVMRLVLTTALWPTLTGIAGGLLLGVLATPWLRRLLYGVAPTDPTTWSLALAAILFAVAAAALVPVLRAGRIEAAEALRDR